MIKLKSILSERFEILIIAMSIAYCTFIVVYSIDLIDSSFILSFVERLKSGQQIYKDFDYVRPFGSLIFWEVILHYIPKYFKYLFLVCRIIVLSEFLLIAYLTFKIFFENGNKAIILLLFIFSIHSFNIMPWHTIDGIFFSVLSLYFFKKQFHLLSILFLMIAVLTKQSFYIFGVIAGAVYTYSFIKINLKIKKADLIYFSIGSVIILFLVFKLQIFSNYKIMLEQITGSSSVKDLIKVGFKSYLFTNNYLNIFLIILLGLFYYLKYNKNILFLLFSALIIFISISSFFNSGNYLGTKITFLLLIYYTIKIKFDVNLFLLFILAWCSSISWGSNTPILLLFSLFLITFKEYFIKRATVYFFLIFGLINFFLVRILFPYFNTSILKTHYVWVRNCNSISGLLINEDTYNYVVEAQKLTKKYGKPDFLPGSPLLDIINNIYVNKSSWEMDVEYPSWKFDCKNLINTTFIVDRKPTINYKDGFFKSSFTNYIVKHKTKTDSTSTFIIYK